MVRNGGLRQADGLLQIARAKAFFVASDQIAAGAALRFEEFEDSQARRIGEGFQDRNEAGFLFHRSKSIELSPPSVKRDVEEFGGGAGI